VVRQLSRALEQLALPPKSVVLVTDIGCVGLADYLFPSVHTVHTTHGRSTAFATGMALADTILESPGLKPVVMIGDGGAMIGLLHLVQAAQLNIDVTVLLHNNFLFGMTGGQHSALSPERWVTATTPDGNALPPLDMLALLRASHATFLARHLSTSPELAGSIAQAIDSPGFSVVEIVELCTAYGTRWNQVTGASLKEIVERQGYALGTVEAEKGRPGFRELERRKARSAQAKPTRPAVPRVDTPAKLAREIRVVIAGTAGERVQSAAALLCRVALAAGVYSTQKNDNLTTQGSGFSLSELGLSPVPIDYTGVESPDVVLAVSVDGWKELEANGILGACRDETLVIVDAEVEGAPLRGHLVRLPLRRDASPKRAAMSALAAWLEKDPVLPAEAWQAVLALEPEGRRNEWNIALEIGRRLFRESGRELNTPS
jgi:pyruvate/2-oxoacid:ferredoxin oxidoreductase beta subunit